MSVNDVPEYPYTAVKNIVGNFGVATIVSFTELQVKMIFHGNKYTIVTPATWRENRPKDKALIMVERYKTSNGVSGRIIEIRATKKELQEVCKQLKKD